MVFTSKFFSKAGQKERFKNVFETFKAIPTGKVRANVKNKTLKAGLEFVGNNPFTTAGLITPAGLIGKSVATKGITSTLTGIANKVGGLSTKTKVIGSTVGVLTGSTLLATPKDKAVKVLGGLTPESFARAGSDIGGAISGRKGILDIIKENPVIASVGALAGLTVAGKALLPSAVGAVQSQRQISATKDLAKSLSPNDIISNTPLSETPINQTPILVPSTGEEPVKRKRVTSRRKATSNPRISLKSEVNIGNFIKNKVRRKLNGRRNTKRSS